MAELAMTPLACVCGCNAFKIVHPTALVCINCNEVVTNAKWQNEAAIEVAQHEECENLALWKAMREISRGDENHMRWQSSTQKLLKAAGRLDSAIYG